MSGLMARAAAMASVAVWAFLAVPAAAEPGDSGAAVSAQAPAAAVSGGPKGAAKPQAGTEAGKQDTGKVAPPDQLKDIAPMKWPSLVAFACLLLWLVIVIVYYIWAIIRYNINYGLTHDEWKVLHPAMYAPAGKREEYEKRKAELIQGSPQVTAFKTGGDPDKGDDLPNPGEKPPGAFEEPKENPYKNDSFGLPPGTVRGTLALTSMVCVVLIEGVNLFSPVNLENHFTDLLTTFKMVIAFYFGSRALELLENKRAEVKKQEAKAEVMITNPNALNPQTPQSTADAFSAPGRAPEESGQGAASSPAAAKSAPTQASVQQAILDQASKFLPASVTKPLAKLLELPSERPAVMEGLTEFRRPNIMVNAPIPSAPEPAPPNGSKPAAAAAAAGATGSATATALAAASVAVKPAATAAALQQNTPLKVKVLALTAAFETGLGFPDCFGAVAGNFDGQGISFGALQWNLGQGTLQPLLLKTMRNHEAVAKQIFGTGLFEELMDVLALPKEEQLAWVNKYQITKQNPATGVRRLVLDPKLSNPLRDLGKTPEMIQIQADEAGTRYMKAISNCEQYELDTERGVALMFDINVQNGLVDKGGAGARIRQDYDSIDRSRPAAEVQEERMKIIARRRSDVVIEKWRADVLSRKMTIATGQGEVHKRKYDLTDFKIGLSAYVA